MVDHNISIDETVDDLVIGYLDVIEEVPLELRRVMTANSRALEQLPGDSLVNVPSNEG